MMLAIGLMSGTSLDGIDASLIRSDGANQVQILSNHQLAYTQAVRNALKALLLDQTNWPELERTLTILHADLVNQLVVKSIRENLVGSKSEIDVIGFHGQTLKHNPSRHFTWQIGDANLLAKLTGIPVVADFRRRDMAYGGQGAPLVPVFHRAIMSDQEKRLAVLNIGGVANVTLIGADKEELVAFDTGPGNALIDDLTFELFNLNYDKDGAIAFKGTANNQLVDQIIREDPFFKLSPPKSLDRNHFKYVQDKVLASDWLTAEDKISTITQITVMSIVESLKHASLEVKPKTLYVCGGGAKNLFIMKNLAEALNQNGQQVAVKDIQEIGFNPDYIESQAFAYLAIRNLKKLPSSYPTTTGVSEPVTSGAYYQVK